MSTLQQIATERADLQREMDYVAVRLAAAAVKEKIPPEYATKYVNILLEEAMHKNDSTAERHHVETVHHTINDVVSQFEEKIVSSTENIISDIRREFGALASKRPGYTSIYSRHRSNDSCNSKKINGVFRQCLKNFFDGSSFSATIPLKNVARRHILSEKQAPVLQKPEGSPIQAVRQAQASVTSKAQASSPRASCSPNGVTNGVRLGGSAGTNGMVQSPSRSIQVDSRPSNETVGTSGRELPKKTSSFSKPVLVTASQSAVQAESPTLTPKNNVADTKTPAWEKDGAQNGNNKRQWDVFAANGSSQTDANGNRNAARNKKPNGSEGGFKSGMDYLVKRHAEGKAPMDIDLDKPKKALGLSYPTRAMAGGGGGYNSTSNDAESSQPAVPERYVPLLGADITPEMINMVLNMKLDVSLYKVMEEDIAGLDSVKKTLKDKVVQPILRPELHRGLLRAPKGVLLFGPPGTGKTTLSKWIANVSNANCFEVSPSSITSKFHGESESIIKTLFKVADFDHPSIIFIDEVDALLGKRGNNDADLSIRMKNQLLQMMDGLHCAVENRVVVVIAATNRPTMLDDAALRRFGKRVLIPLPDMDTRQKFVHDTLKKNCDGKCELSAEELGQIAAATDGWNGSDLLALCMKAAEYSYDDTVEAYGGIDKIPDATAFRGIVMKDFTRALKLVHPSYSGKGESYFEDFNKQYGSH